MCDAVRGVKSILRSWRLRKTFLLGIPRFYQGAVSKSPRGGVGAPSGAGTRGETWNPSEGPAPARRSQSRSTGLQTLSFERNSARHPLVRPLGRARYAEDPALKQARGLTTEFSFAPD